MVKKIGVIVGSLRKESWNRKLANALKDITPPNILLQLIEIGQLPLYNQDPDDEGTPLAEWTKFRKEMNEVDGFLFLTPEYNRSIPAPLKNAIDVGSQPYGKSVWSGKPGAVISSSIGNIGGFGANQHLRQTFVFLDVRVMQQPEAYIAHIHNIFNENGQIVNEGTRDFLTHYMTSFGKWVAQFN